MELLNGATKEISIHVLREEDDYFFREKFSPVSRFLSTSSARRTTRCLRWSRR